MTRMLQPWPTEAPRASEPAELAIIGQRYEVQAVVGRGGMGAVYRVRDLRTNKELALKRLRVRVRRKNEVLALFEREFYTLAQLRHPRIIEVHDYGVDAHGAYYTMELLSGADMRELAPLPWRLACKYLREVATSLALLHARRLVHRDVTPQNVRVDHDGHCKLIDFGALADFGKSGEVIGTPPYVPPEALDGKTIDQRLDLYALGCLAYFMLTGQNAYPATDSRQLRAFWARTPLPPSTAPKKRADDAAVGGEALPEIPAALDALVMSLLSLDPMARPSSAGAVIDQLDAITRGEQSEEASLADSYLASAPLCGRKVELTKVKLALDRVLRGRGTTCVLSGPTGVGRTRLLGEFALRAKLQGCITVQIDAAEHEGPYGAALALASQLAWRLPDEACKHAAELARQNPAQMRALYSLAPALCAALGLRAPSVRPLQSEQEPTRERAYCLSALHALISEIARQQPLAVLVDDVHRADEASLSVLGTLAHDARNLKLLVVVACRTGDEALSESNLHALMQFGAAFEIGPLTERQLSEWLSSVFGDAPNLGRLANFLYERTRGRPASVAALVRFLIAHGELRYRDGTWVLPNEPAQLPLPADTDDATLDRLQALPEPTRALAEAFGMHRGALSLELCAALSTPANGSAPTRDALAAQLEALVSIEVLTLGREGYRVSSERLREKLEARIDATRRTALHLRMGEAILARGAQTPLEQLAAGVHLLEAQDPRGQALTTHAASVLLSRVDGLGGAVRLLERALVIANERGFSSAHRLALLGALCLGGYVADHHLVRYQEQLSSALDDMLLLPMARKLRAIGNKLGRYWGYSFGLLAIGWSVVRYYAQPRHARPERFRRVVLWGVSGMVALCGRAALCLDKPAIDRIVARIAPLRGLGMRDPGGFAIAYCEALGIATQDRYGTTHALWLRLEKSLNRPGAMREVALEQRRLWIGGVSYALGLFESFRGDPIVLQRAEELEASGTDMHAMIAAQLRLQYHGFRGETEQVRKAYERMESCAIQTGSSWQVETWSAISINLFATLWHDVIIAKRAMRETQRMKDDLPSLTRYALSSEGTYLLRRGQPAECAEVYERLLAAEQPLSRIGWCTCHGLLAEAYNQLGMHDKAKAVCERALSVIAPDDRVYFAMRIELELPYAVALSGLGEHERATEHLNMLLECYARFGSPLALGSVHETLARIALARGERKRFTQHLKEVEAHFTKLGNPALIARFQALSDLAGEGGGFVTKVAVMREVRAFDAAIEPIDDAAQGARAILAWLMRTCEGYDGYLFGPAEQPEDEPVLLAATTDKEPGAEVFETVSSSLRKLGGDGDTTNLGTGVATQAHRDGGSSHLYLLSYLEADEFHAEGALVLLGRAPHAPPVRYELLQAAAQQLRRLSDHSGS